MVLEVVVPLDEDEDELLEGNEEEGEEETEEDEEEEDEEEEEEESSEPDDDDEDDEDWEEQKIEQLQIDNEELALELKTTKALYKSALKENARLQSNIVKLEQSLNNQKSLFSDLDKRYQDFLLHIQNSNKQ